MTAEVPTLTTILDSVTCAQKGLCPVGGARARNPRQLYYEVHGDLAATQKMVLSVNGTCGVWSAEVHHFGTKPDHAVLVFDNRGVGNSDCGKYEPYKSSEMAMDTLDLLNFLKWDQDRSIHIFGVSLGGMISQELALLIPSRIKSLTLISTRCGNVWDLPSMKILNFIFRSGAIAMTREESLDMIMDILFPVSHLNKPTTKGKTEQDDLREYLSTLPFQVRPAGIFGQICAATGHYCSDPKLESIGRTVSPGKIAVVLGDRDELVYSLRSLQLHDRLPGSELVVFKDGGHALNCQFTEEVLNVMERIMMEGNRAFSSESSAKLIESL
ncbi:hypothetical protein MJO28_014935 [Puccinia striiformis f. sp. tritici]|uniref:Uncharacterized protein n=1 Tax=Puccinia striiformis f. sp. tritici TaxID=168172 RepID=A0ACC0DR54_9BASI|nr:hypothetical protein MJO29_014702 [Puccinia striiformis f. sp. tritici]KAI7938015.1 hypothetical protein MJO28_014935 [Puccinia striiformis f. sp. tritici]